MGMGTKNLIKPRNGFTLIEMLVVAAILCILAAIAVPNFLEAQTRSKVARVKADLRTVAMALEHFSGEHDGFPGTDIKCGKHLRCVDHNTSKHTQCEARWTGWLSEVNILTTPIAYLPNIKLPDPFFTGRPISHRKIYSRCYFYARSHNGNAIGPAYAVYSGGPSRNTPRPPNGGRYDYHHLLDMHDRSWFEALQYDITNGTYSRGIIMRYQK